MQPKPRPWIQALAWIIIFAAIISAALAQNFWVGVGVIGVPLVLSILFSRWV